MACGFCATGQAGFDRHLTTGEIVEQVVVAARWARDRRAAAVQRRVHGHGRAARQLRPHVGRGRAHPRRPRPVGPPHHGVDRRRRARHPPPGRRRRCRSTSPCRSTRPTTTLRERARADQPALPARRAGRAPAAGTSTPRAGGCRSSGRSSTASTTPTSRPGASPAIARPLGAHVNLIPLNPTPGYATRGHSPAAVRTFHERLRALGVNATVRRNRGTEIDAACGQLRAHAPVRAASSLTSPSPDEHRELAGADRVGEVLPRLDHRAGPHHGALEHRGARRPGRPVRSPTRHRSPARLARR